MIIATGSMWGPMLIGVNKRCWLMTLSVMMVVLMCILGVWQLNRADEKRKWQSALMQAKFYTDDWFAHVVGGQLLRVQGRYVPAQQFLLDNKIVNGAPSYDVITPFLTQNDVVFFVNRGAVRAMKSRQKLPVLAPMEDRNVELFMRVYLPSKKLFRLSDLQYASAGWPKRVQYYDSEYFSKTVDGLSDKAIFPAEVRLEPEQYGVLIRHWQNNSLSAEKHLAYAVQWFAMAGALLSLLGYYSYKKEL